MISTDRRFGGVSLTGKRLLCRHGGQPVRRGEPIPLQLSRICGRLSIAGDIG